MYGADDPHTSIAEYQIYIEEKRPIAAIGAMSCLDWVPQKSKMKSGQRTLAAGQARARRWLADRQLYIYYIYIVSS